MTNGTTVVRNPQSGAKRMGSASVAGAAGVGLYAWLSGLEVLPTEVAFAAGVAATAALSQVGKVARDAASRGSVVGALFSWIG